MFAALRILGCDDMRGFAAGRWLRVGHIHFNRERSNSLAKAGIFRNLKRGSETHCRIAREQ